MKQMELTPKKTYMLKFEDGEDIVGAIKKFAEDEDIRAGTIDFALGGVKTLVAGYVDVDITGTPKLPTHFIEEVVFDLSKSGTVYETPGNMPYKDVLFAGDISIVKKEDGTVKDRVVHIHLSEGGPKTEGITSVPKGIRGGAFSGGDSHFHNTESGDGDYKTVHVLRAIVGPYADAKITSYEGSLVREINPKTRVSEIMRLEK